MKPFNRITKYLRKVKCNQRLLFVLFVLGLSLPNFLLFFTEPTSLLVRLTNIVLPMSLWWYVMTLLRRPGKMFWALFLFVFFDAFQIVLLDMYGEAILAVDMFLNVATTNATEAGEQLCGILPAVIFVFVVYLPLLFWGLVSMCHASLPRQFLKRQRRIAFVGMGVGFAMLVGCILSYDWRKSYIKICRGLARKQKRYHIVFTIQKVAAFVISTALFVVSVASVISSSHNPFIYFRF